jgi:hypothetical protein
MFSERKPFRIAPAQAVFLKRRDCSQENFSSDAAFSKAKLLSCSKRDVSL